MKPTSQQIQLLKKYLRDTLSYRETYEEIYDHILSAIENCTADVSFEEAVNGIINSDFGGVKGLVKIEKQYYSSAVEEVISQQWYNFVGNFKFPQLIYSLVLLGSIFYGMLYFTAQSYITVGLIFALVMVPGVFVIVRYFMIGYALKDTKRSIKDKIIGQVASKPLLVFNPGVVFLIGKNQVSLWLNTHPFIVSLLLFTVTLYVIAFVKLCRHDFKAYQLS
jgi:hypothetical protein